MYNNQTWWTSFQNLEKKYFALFDFPLYRLLQIPAYVIAYELTV